MDTNDFMMIEMIVFGLIALGLAGWQLWSLRDHKLGDRSKKDDE